MEPLERPHEFQLSLAKEDFKFNAAHFVSHDGGRERLHGHNYSVSVLINGFAGPDGYVLDFSEAKRAVRAVCAELNERFLLPTRSRCTGYIVTPGGQVELRVLKDGSFFSFPAADVALLPLAHTSVEELSALLAGRIVARLGLASKAQAARKVTSVTVGVTETPGQEARCRVDAPFVGEDGGVS